MSDFDNAIRDSIARDADEAPDATGLLAKVHMRRGRLDRRRRVGMGALAVATAAVLAAGVATVVPLGDRDRVTVREDRSPTSAPRRTPSPTDSAPGTSPSPSGSRSGTSPSGASPGSTASPDKPAGDLGLRDGTRFTTGPSFPLTPTYLPDGMSIGAVEWVSDDVTVLHVDRGDYSGLDIGTASADRFDRIEGVTQRTPMRVNGRDTEILTSPEASQMVWERTSGLWVSITYYGDLPRPSLMTDIADQLSGEDIAAKPLPVRLGLVPDGYEVAVAETRRMALRRTGSSTQIAITLVSRGSQPPNSVGEPGKIEGNDYFYSIVGDPTIVVQTPGEPEFTPERVKRFARAIKLR